MLDESHEQISSYHIYLIIFLLCPGTHATVFHTPIVSFNLCHLFLALLHGLLLQCIVKPV